MEEAEDAAGTAAVVKDQPHKPPEGSTQQGEQGAEEEGDDGGWLAWSGGVATGWGLSGISKVTKAVCCIQLFPIILLF